MIYWQRRVPRTGTFLLPAQVALAQTHQQLHLPGKVTNWKGFCDLMPGRHTDQLAAMRSRTRITALPEDILSIIYCRVAKRYFKQDDGFRRCCKLAEALPSLWSLSLPRAPLKLWKREKLSWEGIKWVLSRQPSASLVHIVVLDKEPGSPRDRRFIEEWHHKHTWEGPVQEEQEESDEEMQALLEVSEDKRGFRALVLKVFPRYPDDADDSTAHRASERLRPLVDKLLRLGVDGLRGLKLDANLITYPNVLGQLPLRHLKLEIDKSSTAHLKQITAALGQCTTLEYLCIAGSYCSEGLPNLYLQKAPNLKRVHLLACFPRRRLCLPPRCQLRLDLHSYPKSWNQMWQSKDGRRLMGCIPAMSLKSLCGTLWPLNPQDFKVLQYLDLECSGDFTDLSWLESIPHVRLGLFGSQDIILHTSGSWQSLEVYNHYGFEIGFADIDAFVRENPKFLFGTFKITKAWRNMSNALYAASKRQGAGCFPPQASDGSYSRRLSNIKGVTGLWGCDKHLVCVEEFWPNQSLQSCVAPIAPCPKLIKVPHGGGLSKSYARHRT